MGMNIEDLEKEFWKHVEIGRNLPKQAPDVMLIAYGYFKQATEGDNGNPRPTENSDVVRTFMHDQWKRMEGTSADDAMRMYIEYIQYLETQVKTSAPFTK